jgi:WD40 repeat protein
LARVFISHAGEDVAQAAQLRKWLIEDGHEVFLDRDLRDGIVLGDEWEERLHERLRWADVMVCVITTAYVNSVWCSMEVGIARSQGSRLVPIRTEPGATHPALKQVQYADMTRDPDAARTALSEALRRVDQQHGLGWADNRSPFPGLRSFDTAMHRVFYGRDTEIAQLAKRLRSPAERTSNAVLLLVGPSGCGKSSLLRAGLLPTMAAEPDWWTLSAFTPGRDPVAALVRELAAAAKALGLDWPVGGARDRVDNGEVVELVDTLLFATPGSQRKRLLVNIDQLEELLVQTPPAELTSFASVLRTMLTGPVSVVATVRPEFLDRVLGHPALSSLSLPTHTLRPLRREALRSVIEGPARHAGLTVSAELVELLVNDTDSGDALPLLAFTLEQLAEGVSRGGELSRSRYDLLGGVRGALIHQADEALTDAIKATGRDQEAVLATLLRLVTVDEQNRPIRWHAKRAHLSAAEAVELDAFVAHRLFSVDTVGRDTTVSASHEAFFTEWPPLDTTIRNKASALRARHLVEDAAREWDTNSRPREKLWERGQLAAVMEDTGVQIRSRTLASPLVDLDPTTIEFLYLSHRRERIRRRRGVLAIAVATAMVMALVITIQQRANEAQLRLAVARQLQAQVDVARDTNPRLALALGVAAHHLQPDNDTRASLVETLMTTRYRGHLPFEKPVASTAFSPDGRVLAMGTDNAISPKNGGSIALWDFADPGQPRLFSSASSGISDTVSMVRFSPDGRTLLTAQRRDVLLWDVSDPTRPQQVGAMTIVGATQAFFSPDGRTVVLTDFNKDVIRWDITNPAQPRQIETLLRITDYVPKPDDIELGVLDMASSPNGRLGVTSSMEGGVTLWNSAKPNRPVQLVTPSDELIVRFIFSPDGRTLVINQETGPALWDLTDPARPQRLGEVSTTAGVRTMAFSPDGRMLAAALGDNSVGVWNVIDRAHPRLIGTPLGGHSDYPAALAFSPDGHTLVSVGERESLVWQATGPTRPRPLDPPVVSEPIDYPYPAYTEPTFSPDGRTLVTGNNTASQLWDITDQAGPRRIGPRLVGHKTPAQAAAFAADGRTLLTASEEQIIVWDVTDRARPVRIGHYAPPEVMTSFVVSDNRVVANTNSSTILIWDLTGRIDPKPTTGLRKTAGAMAMFGQSSPDGKTLVTEDSNIELWDASDPQNIHLVPTPALSSPEADAPVAFSPDADMLATSSADNRLHLWGISTPTEPRHLGTSIIDNHAQFHTMTYSHDGLMLATSSLDGTIALWDVIDPTKPRRLGEPTYSKHVFDTWLLRFSPNDQTLLIAGSNNDLDPRLILAPNDQLRETRSVIALWNLTQITDLRDQPVVHACAVIRHGLNQPEWNQYLPDLPFEETCPVSP